MVHTTGLSARDLCLLVHLLHSWRPLEAPAAMGVPRLILCNLWETQKILHGGRKFRNPLDRDSQSREMFKPHSTPPLKSFKMWSSLDHHPISMVQIWNPRTKSSLVMCPLYPRLYPILDCWIPILEAINQYFHRILPKNQHRTCDLHMKQPSRRTRRTWSKWPYSNGEKNITWSNPFMDIFITLDQTWSNSFQFILYGETSMASMRWTHIRHVANPMSA
jgi:hypothetical protein